MPSAKLFEAEPSGVRPTASPASPQVRPDPPYFSDRLAVDEPAEEPLLELDEELVSAGGL